MTGLIGGLLVQDGLAPLHYAVNEATSKPTKEVVKLLILSNADVDGTTEVTTCRYSLNSSPLQSCWSLQ